MGPLCALGSWGNTVLYCMVLHSYLFCCPQFLERVFPPQLQSQEPTLDQNPGWNWLSRLQTEPVVHRVVLMVHLLVCEPLNMNMYVQYVYLCGTVSHVTDHSSLAGDNAGQFFGEGRVLKLPYSSRTMKRKGLFHQHTLIFWGHSLTQKHTQIMS